MANFLRKLIDYADFQNSPQGIGPEISRKTAILDILKLDGASRESAINSLKNKIDINNDYLKNTSNINLAFSNGDYGLEDVYADVYNDRSQQYHTSLLFLDPSYGDMFKDLRLSTSVYFDMENITPGKLSESQKKYVQSEKNQMSEESFKDYIKSRNKLYKERISEAKKFSSKSPLEQAEALQELELEIEKLKFLFEEYEKPSNERGFEFIFKKIRHEFLNDEKSSPDKSNHTR